MNADSLNQNPVPEPASLAVPKPASPVPAIVGKVLLHSASLSIAVVAFILYEHFKLHGSAGQSLASLGVAAGFGLAPLRALAHAFFEIERKVMHFAHGLGGLAVLGLGSAGVISGAPLLDHAAMAPFAIMGAAQAMMHQDHPRNREQAAALRRFATSLPEVAQFTKQGDLSSPERVRRAVAVLSDLLAKAQALGETELRADPGFQSALARLGLTLGLDSIDHAIESLAANPAASNKLPGLRAQLARARTTIDRR